MSKRVRRSKSEPASAPSVSRFDSDTAGTFSGLPYVLTVEAVIKGEMPELGKSGMPASLEQYVPAAFRFWKAATAEAARSTRDALVDVGMIKADDIALVNDAHHVVVRRMYLGPVHTEKADAALIERAPALVHAASVLSVAKDSMIYALTGTASDIEILGEGEWLLELPNTAESQKAALAKAHEAKGSVFMIETRPDSMFLTNVEVMKLAHVNVVAAQVVESIAKGTIRLVKADEAAPVVEERFVLGVVLEPDVVDSQMDTYDAATIRDAAHRYMENHAAVGLQHKEIVTGRVKILESYIAPVDFVINDVTIKAGTWLMGFRVVDDDLWQSVKDGSLTGLSIGGDAVREPVS
jgi:hypothetical protein